MSSTEKINRAAAALARERRADARAACSARSAHSASGIEPWGRHPGTRRRPFQPQARGLLEGGVDGFILETFSDVDELHAAFCASARSPTCPIIAQMTIGEDGSTAYGTAVETSPRSLDRARAPTSSGSTARSAPRGAGGGRAHGRGDEPAALRAAQRRPAPRRGRPQDLHGLPRIHGELRPPHGRGRRPVRRRLLRHHARPHQADPGFVRSGHCRRRLRQSDAHGPAPQAARCRAGPAGGALGLGPQARRGRVRHHASRSCRPRAGTRRRCSTSAAPLKAGRGRRERARRAPGAEPDGRASRGADHRARGRTRGGVPLLLPRPQPARHAERPARRGGRRACATC